MDEVGHDVVEEALIVRDDDRGAVGGAERVHAVGDNLERVDIEARIGLVEDGQLRFEHGHLEIRCASSRPAGEPVVHRAAHQRRVDARSAILSRMSAMDPIASSSGSPRCFRTAFSAALRK